MTRKVLMVAGALGAAAAGVALWSLLPPRRKTVVVVLGISKRDAAQRRVDAAKWVVSKQSVSHIITSGRGEGIDGKREADWMLERLWGVGVPVLSENASSSTVGNVKNVLPMLEHGSKVIVVSDHDHVKSAAYCFRKAGYETYYVRWPEAVVVSASTDPNECKRAGCC